jgi:hypothetical protein
MMPTVQVRTSNFASMVLVAATSLGVRGCQAMIVEADDEY